ncbi:MAG: HD domain-containing protein, partial [Armatimonadetes bacterium]|nr:HD domain-containing protein [Armatimonadota bacterium]
MSRAREKIAIGRAALILACFVAAILAPTKGASATRSLLLNGAFGYVVAWCSIFFLTRSLSPILWMRLIWSLDSAFALLLFFASGAGNSPFFILFYLLAVTSATERHPGWGWGGILALSVIPHFLVKAPQIPPLALKILPILLIYYFSRALLGEIVENIGTHKEKEWKGQLDKALKTSRTQELRKTQLTMELHDTIRELRLVHELSQKIVSNLELEEVLQLIVLKSREEMQTEIAFLMLAEGDLLTVKYARGITDVTRDILGTRVGVGLLGETFVKRMPVCLNNLKEASGTSDFWGATERFRNLLAVPLIPPPREKSPATSGGEPIGLICLANLAGGDFGEKHVQFLSILGVSAAIAIENARLLLQLQRAFDETITVLAAAVEIRDSYTHVMHTQNVSKVAGRIAAELGLPERQIRSVERGAILHDVGKIAVPDEILLKSDKLSDQEWVVMRDHTVHGGNSLKNVSFFHEIVPMVGGHHERYDGKGY